MRRWRNYFCARAIVLVAGDFICFSGRLVLGDRSPGPVTDELAKADSVFRGRVDASTARDGSAPDPHGEINVVFTVTRVWKGKIRAKYGLCQPRAHTAPCATSWAPAKRQSPHNYSDAAAWPTDFAPASLRGAAPLWPKLRRKVT
jgi:hypothetical protein